MAESRKVTHAGSWTIEELTVVDEDGVTSGVSITDGKASIVTAANPADLMIALGMHLEVESWSRA